jgi:tRNA pseudouridine38-40 synthase
MRVRLVVAYDGTDFHGFARNEGVVTVGGALADAVGRVLGEEVELTCAGRTDAGVHARGQVVTFDTAATAVDLRALRDGVTRLCGGPIVVRDVATVPDDFDARFSARSRTYRYTILNTEVPDPFLAATTWHVPTPLDQRVLVLACDPLIGEHDFSAFCRAPKTDPSDPAPSLVRRVLDARWDEVGDGCVRFEITASSFCHQMVRSLVGTLVEVGRGKRTPGELLGVIRSRDRQAAGQLAPPHGLCLWSVAYDGWCS